MPNPELSPFERAINQLHLLPDAFDAEARTLRSAAGYGPRAEGGAIVYESVAKSLRDLIKDIPRDPELLQVEMAGANHLQDPPTPASAALNKLEAWLRKPAHEPMLASYAIAVEEDIRARFFDLPDAFLSDILRCPLFQALPRFQPVLALIRDEILARLLMRRPPVIINTHSGTEAKS